MKTIRDKMLNIGTRGIPADPGAAPSDLPFLPMTQ